MKNKSKSQKYKIKFSKYQFEEEVAMHYLDNKISLTADEWWDMKDRMNEAIKGVMFQVLAEHQMTPHGHNVNFTECAKVESEAYLWKGNGIYRNN